MKRRYEIDGEGGVTTDHGTPSTAVTVKWETGPNRKAIANGSQCDEILAQIMKAIAKVLDIPVSEISSYEWREFLDRGNTFQFFHHRSGGKSTSVDCLINPDSPQDLAEEAVKDLEEPNGNLTKTAANGCNKTPRWK